MRILFVLTFVFSILFGERILHIGSYNVENLFDLVHDGYEHEEYIPNTSSKWNKKNYKIKLQNLSKVIKDLDVDILALQEVESLAALKDLRFELKQQGVYYQYYKIADKKKRSSIKVALLSKYPFVYTKEIPVTSSYSHRNILEVKYKIDDKEFYLFINHWRAKSKPESYRITSARELIKRIKQIGYDKNIIILGDFNSDYEENIKFLRNRKHNDTKGKTAINDVLKTNKQKQRAIDTKHIDKAFYNLWYDTDEEKRYTYIFRGNKEVLDNIIISQSLLNKQDIYYKPSTITHLGKPYLFSKKQIYRWQTSRKKPRVHLGKGYSDHLPIKAQFVIP